MKTRCFRFGQTTTEYAILIAVVAAVIVAMGLYVQRSIKANLKMTQDQVNYKFLPLP